jgi:hypothetical protein
VRAGCSYQGVFCLCVPGVAACLLLMILIWALCLDQTSKSFSGPDHVSQTNHTCSWTRLPRCETTPARRGQHMLLLFTRSRVTAESPLIILADCKHSTIQQKQLWIAKQQ